ncbi:hypothetical protein [Psychrobacter ciconiae]|uniref:hypothetical protein n=1 Tax=Psychrobacter ciconiae TaxID=1553449 RepID=UPI001917ACDE|nr:hypothetical protein [Psychrobacter ciconiae]
METLIIWVLVVALILMNIALRIENKKLKAQLLLKRDPNEQRAFLQNQMAQNKSKPAAIKALRQQYPELSLLEASQLWQSLDGSNNKKTAVR